MTRHRPPKWQRNGSRLAFAIGALLIFLAASPAPAQDRTRVDVYAPDGTRQGYAIVDERTGRVDTFDRDSKRTGYGKVAPDRRLDLYSPDGRRLGTTAWPTQSGKK